MAFCCENSLLNERYCCYCLGRRLDCHCSKSWHLLHGGCCCYYHCVHALKLCWHWWHRLTCVQRHTCYPTVVAWLTRRCWCCVTVGSAACRVVSYETLLQSSLQVSSRWAAFKCVVCFYVLMKDRANKRDWTLRLKSLFWCCLYTVVVMLLLLRFYSKF